MAEVIKFEEFNYQFITASSRSTLIQLQTWMKTIHMQANGIGKNASIIVYYASDINKEVLNALKETYMDCIFRAAPINIFTDIAYSNNDQGKTISIYVPVNSIMSRLPIDLISKAIIDGAAVLPKSKIGVFSFSSDVGKMSLQTIYDSENGWAGIPDNLYVNDEDNVCTVSLEETFKLGRSFYIYKDIFTPPSPSPSPSPAKPANSLIVYSLNATEKTKEHLLEYDWLCEIFGAQIEIKKMPETSAGLKSGECIWILVSRADLHIWQKIFSAFTSENRNFKAIHCSDEFCQDDISWYNLPICKGVVRNYYRDECSSMSNVVQIPLGYSAKSQSEISLSNRKYTWSFEGTAWFDRPKKIDILNAIKPNYNKLYPNWNDPSSKSRIEYFNIVKDSVFIPILRGNNYETFRLYEAIEAGCIPIVVREEGDTNYWTWLKTNLPLLEIGSYEHAIKVMEFLKSNTYHLEKYRDEIKNAYLKWKNICKLQVQALI